jgi:hypothetical protein
VRILFFHGWQSIPGGVKPTFLLENTSSEWIEKVLAPAAGGC